jgi:hypothetical protein
MAVLIRPTWEDAMKARQLALTGSLLAALVFGVPADAAEEDVTVGFSAASTGWPWFVNFIERFNARAEENGWETVVLSANADVPTQLNQIYDLVARRVTYLVVGPIDGSAVIPGLKAAHEAGIPAKSSERSLSAASTRGRMRLSGWSQGTRPSQLITEQCLGPNVAARIAQPHIWWPARYDLPNPRSDREFFRSLLGFFFSAR